MSRQGTGYPSHHSRPQTRTRIEEIHDDAPTTAQQVNRQPIVEEPDDEPQHQTHTHRPQTRSSSNGRARPTTNQHHQQQHHQYHPYTSHAPYGHQARSQQRPRSIIDEMMGDMGMFGFGGFGGFGPSLMNEMMAAPMGTGHGTSFSSVSYSSSQSGSGPAVHYSSSKTVRMGPGGVAEVQESVQDSRTGTEKVTVQRRIGDQAYTVSKEKTSSGQERTTRHLENMTDADAAAFDQRWQTASTQVQMPRIGSTTRYHPQPNGQYIEYHQSPTTRHR